MRAKVVLLARVKIGNRYPFLPVEIKRNNPVSVEGATYYLRYSQDGKQIVQPVGLNVETAYAAYQNRELAFTRSRLGLPLSQTTEPSRILISDAVAKFTTDLESDVLKGKKSKATLLSYRNTVENFRDHCRDCGVRLIHEITADVLKQHETWLFTKIQRRKRGDQINTIANRFRFLSVFLGACPRFSIRESRGGSFVINAVNGTTDLGWEPLPRKVWHRKVASVGRFRNPFHQERACYP